MHPRLINLHKQFAFCTGSRTDYFHVYAMSLLSVTFSEAKYFNILSAVLNSLWL